MTVNEILEKYGYTQTGFARAFNIPLRTVQDWTAGRRTPPEYIPALLDEILTLRNGDRIERFFVISGSYDGDIFGGDKPFETYEEALQEAEMQWHRLTECERNKLQMFYIAVGCVEYSDGFQMLDENHDIIKSWI